MIEEIKEAVDRHMADLSAGVARLSAAHDQFFSEVGGAIEAKMHAELDQVADAFHRSNLLGVDAKIAAENAVLERYGIDPTSVEAGEIIIARTMRALSY